MNTAKVISLCIWLVLMSLYSALCGFSLFFHGSFAYLVWLAVPTLVIFNATRLSGKITFLSLHGPDGEPPWAIVVLGFILHAVQLIPLVLLLLARLTSEQG